MKREALGCALAAMILSAAPAALAQDDGSHTNTTLGDGSLAIGVGWTVPASITDITRASVRARIAGMELVPYVNFSLGNSKSVSEPAGAAKTTSDSGSAVSGVGLNVHLPLRSRGEVELQAIGGARLNRTGSSTNPQGPQNNTATSESTMAVGYGLAVQWWFADPLSLTASAMNSVLAYRRDYDEVEVQGGLDKDTTTSWTFGAIWDPTVSVMVNLWF